MRHFQHLSDYQLLGSQVLINDTLVRVENSYDLLALAALLRRCRHHWLLTKGIKSYYRILDKMDVRGYIPEFVHVFSPDGATFYYMVAPRGADFNLIAW